MKKQIEEQFEKVFKPRIIGKKKPRKEIRFMSQSKPITFDVDMSTCIYR